jgi:purine-nucleoside phosphorylase
MELADSFFKKKWNQAPELAIVLGSGLASLTHELQIDGRLCNSEIPGAKNSSVEGHRGELLLARYANRQLLCVSGRLHGYEGYSPQEVVFVLRSLSAWGIKNFILTNSAGSTHEAFKPGEVVLIKDHINFTGQNPLTGRDLFGGPRFPDSSDLYSRSWRDRVIEKAHRQQVPVREATYMGVAGPNYETAAEIKMFAQWGADIVGMSTVWESLALHQMGSRVLGISLISNFGTGVRQDPLLHEDVLQIGKQSFSQFKQTLDLAIDASERFS